MGLFSFAGNILGGLLGKSAAKKQAAASRELNQNKIQWTVADAQKAGIHPLAALGSPVSGSWAAPQADHSMGDAVASAGQSLAQIPIQQGAAKQSALQAQLLQAQIGRTHAETANLVSEATSRSTAANFRRNLLGNPDSLGVEEVPLIQRHLGPTGGSTDVPVGPDLGEVASGAVIRLLQDLEDKRIDRYFNKTNQRRRGGYRRNRKNKTTGQRAYESSWRYKNKGP